MLGIVALLFTLASPALSAAATNDTSACSFVEAFAKVRSPDGVVQAEVDFTFDVKSGTFVTASIYSGLKGANTRWPFHVHVNPISPSGDCSSAGGHLNPMAAPKSCDPSQPAQCQEGDLSGMLGMMNGTDSGITSFPASSAPYLRFWPQPFSILGRSVVIHDATTGNPLACGNITSCLDGTARDDHSPTFLLSNFQTDYTTSNLAQTFDDPVSLPPTFTYDSSGKAVDGGIELIYDSACKPSIKDVAPFTWTSGAALPTQAIPTCSQSSNNSTASSSGSSTIIINSSTSSAFVTTHSVPTSSTHVAAPGSSALATNGSSTGLHIVSTYVISASDGLIPLPSPSSPVSSLLNNYGGSQVQAGPAASSTPPPLPTDSSDIPSTGFSSGAGDLQTSAMGGVLPIPNSPAQRLDMPAVILMACLLAAIGKLR